MRRDDRRSVETAAAAKPLQNDVTAASALRCGTLRTHYAPLSLRTHAAAAGARERRRKTRKSSTLKITLAALSRTTHCAARRSGVAEREGSYLRRASRTLRILTGYLFASSSRASALKIVTAQMLLRLGISAAGTPLARGTGWREPATRGVAATSLKSLVVASLLHALSRRGERK